MSNRDWADDDLVEEQEGLPQMEVIANDDGTKTVIEYRLNEDGKKVKSTRRVQERVVQERVNHAVAERKKWAKFGAEENSAPGPNLATTKIGEIVWLKLSQFAAQQKQQEQDAMAQEKKDAVKSSQIRCRRCRGLHYTVKCPYKDTLVPLEEITGEGAAEGAASGADAAGADKNGANAYVPPHMRAGASKLGASADGGRGARDELPTIRISNLSEDTQDDDVRHLCHPFGAISRFFVAKDRNTGQCKGFAFVSFYDKESAEKAIAKLNGYGFDNLILNVEWSNQSK
ncbi:translation initiation factor eIF3 subunit g [Coemansia asiatica]|uniref:Eukaryotic translation initiation factor 3 subunit G n=1 Tax=Coemansia asiatica TaxID=1052880 RepID=A0A9W7XF29_9FUNG|nr:translation initiation factor eIF3 subunit g [Coemansia asiatica]KAJ2875167.1 translation initiation factor eIF3 subunit g [Coemansia asiatica]